MIRVRFEPSGFEVDAQAGETIMDITGARPAAAVPYSCRAATCGTCRVDVLEGGEALAAADELELEVLEIFGDTPDKLRLCSQAKLLGGTVDQGTLTVCED
jgi:2Fe-2S ferredoxin